MYYDIKCPYCGAKQEINHDDGYGYNEDEVYEQCCCICDKIFAYTTSIMFSYEARKADCLNGGNHKWKKTITVPRQYTKMRCEDCGEERKPTEEEMSEIMAS